MIESDISLCLILFQHFHFIGAYFIIFHYIVSFSIIFQHIIFDNIILHCMYCSILILYHIISYYIILYHIILYDIILWEGDSVQTCVFWPLGKKINHLASARCRFLKNEAPRCCQSNDF